MPDSHGSIHVISARKDQSGGLVYGSYYTKVYKILPVHTGLRDLLHMFAVVYKTDISRNTHNLTVNVICFKGVSFQSVVCVPICNKMTQRLFEFYGFLCCVPQPLQPPLICDIKPPSLILQDVF